MAFYLIFYLAFYLTYFDFLSGILSDSFSGSISGISSDILSQILSGILVLCLQCVRVHMPSGLAIWSSGPGTLHDSCGDVAHSTASRAGDKMLGSRRKAGSKGKGRERGSE